MVLLVSKILLYIHIHVFTCQFFGRTFLFKCSMFMMLTSSFFLYIFHLREFDDSQRMTGAKE